MTDEKKKIGERDYLSMQPVNFDCSACPNPGWREQAMCSLCCSLVQDEDGQRYFSPKPIIFDDSGGRVRKRARRQR